VAYEYSYFGIQTVYDPGKPDFFGKCKNKAFLGWRSVLEPLEKQMIQKQLKAYVYLGQDFIFSRSLGWTLKRYGSVKVLKRMWTIVESGVYNKLLNISYKPPSIRVLEPRAIKITGNIFVQFVLHSCGLLFASLILIIEVRRKIRFFFQFVCGVCYLVVKPCLLQSQKQLLMWLKIFVTTRNKLLHW